MSSAVRLKVGDVLVMHTWLDDPNAGQCGELLEVQPSGQPGKPNKYRVRWENGNEGRYERKHFFKRS